MVCSAAIYGLEGLTLTPAERAFFKEANPFGYILFKRNCDNPQQLLALTDSLRELSGNAQVPILIDQEGGRVARLQAPHWRKPPAAAVFADMLRHPAGRVASAQDLVGSCAAAAGSPQDDSLQKARYATRLNARLIAAELRAMGINVNCAPLADIPVPGSHDIIGDRAYGATPEQVVTFAREMAAGLLEGGVMPILKHIPGHGRARVDSHEDLPVVDTSLAELERTDFVPFRELRDIPLGMTAHIIYTALDAERVATTSPVVINYIRQQIGFDGLLMSDDLSMKALRGSFAEKAEATLQAGCDLVLHCNGKLDEMTEVAGGTAAMTTEALRRAAAAWKQLPAAPTVDIAALERELNGLLAANSVNQG